MKQLLTFLLLLACSFSFAQKKNKPANDDLQDWILLFKGY